MHDFHLHSLYSNDSYPWASMENICEAAIDKGLKGICFTDHVDYDYPDSVGIMNFIDYSNEIDEMAVRYGSKLEVYKGIELGMQPHVYEENNAFASKPGIDFILGSVHVVNKRELYKGDFLQGRSDELGILAYFEDLNKCLSTFSNFDSLGHIDGVRRYLSKGEGPFQYSIYKEFIAAVLEDLIEKGKGIEINTSGKRYGLSSFHPMTEILVLYKDLGGKIITIGSDAHKPEDIGFGFHEAADLLKSMNYKYYCIFKKRQPIFVRIE